MVWRIISFSLILIFFLFAAVIKEGFLDFNQKLDEVKTSIIISAVGFPILAYIFLELRDTYFSWLSLNTFLNKLIRKYSFLRKLQMSLYFCILSQTPLLLLTFDKTLESYLPFHLVITFILSLLIVKFVLFFSPPLSFAKRIIGITASFYSPIIFAGYPFTNISWLVILLPFVIGITIPFVSLRTTWWLYTFGGGFPLTKENKWLSKYAFFKHISGTSLIISRLLLWLIITLGSVGYSIANQVTNKTSFPAPFLTLQAACFLGIFGLALWLGTEIRKIRLPI